MQCYLIRFTLILLFERTKWFKRFLIIAQWGFFDHKVSVAVLFQKYKSCDLHVHVSHIVIYEKLMRFFFVFFAIWPLFLISLFVSVQWISFFFLFLNLMRISNTANYVLTVTDRATCVTKDMSTYESKKSTDTCYDCKADLVVLTSLHAVNGLRWYREPKNNKYIV